MHTFKPGDRFFHYTVGRLLGEGFHGEVYEITHNVTGAAFALKTMHLKNVGDARLVRRALAEARGTYGIDHANVIKVLDLNCEENGLVWMRTELLLGDTIADLLARIGRFSPLFALSVAIEAAHGLHAAHEAQIIHRDVKPANLFYVAAARRVVVIDFSIAKVFPEGLPTTMGRAGMGTPAYMPPDQLEGGVPNPAFDIYALGITLWQMLAGRHPFHAALSQQSELFRAHFSEKPASLSEVAGLPAEIDRVVQRALAKDPAQRYRTMREMAQALGAARAWLEGEVAAGRFAFEVPPGEPALPGDGRSRSDYTPPISMPRPELPAPETARRVVLGQSVTPIPQAPTLGGLGGTVPLGDSRVAPAPSARATPDPIALPKPLAATAEVPTARSPARRSPETPMSVTSAAAIAPRARVPWRAVAIAVALVSLFAVVIVVALRAPQVPNATAPVSASSSTAWPPDAAPAPPPPISTEPTVTPAAAATTTTAPRSSGAPKAPARASATTARPAVPPPAPAPGSERPRAPSRLFGVEN